MINVRCWLPACLCILLIGCKSVGLSGQTRPQTSDDTQASSIATQPAAVSPDSKAMIKLSDLQPAVARPARKPSDIPTDQPAAEQLSRGKEFFDRGEYALALPALEQAHGLDPNSAVIRRLLALAHVRLGSLEKAGPHLKAVAQTAGDDAQLQLMLGQYLSATGEREEALLALRRALTCSDAAEDSPVVGEVLVQLAEELRKQGYLTAALEAYDRLDENIDRHGTVYYESRQLRWMIDHPENLTRVRGEMLMALDRFSEAAEVLDAAYRLNKTDTRPALLAVQALLRAGGFERAERLALELLGPAPARAQVESLAIQIFQASGDAAGPQRMYATIRRLHGAPPAAVGLGLSTAALKLGNIEGAMAILAAQSDLTPGDASVAAQIAKAQFAAEQPQQAVQRLVSMMAQAAQGEAGDRNGALAAGEVIDQLAAKSLSPQTVLAIAKVAGEDTSPQKHLRHFVAALLARKIGQSHLATEQLESAIQARSDFAPAYETLAEIHLQQKRLDLVRALISRAQKETSLSVTVLYLQGQAYLNDGEVDKAIGQLKEAVQAGPWHGPSRLLLAKALVRAGRLQEAEQTLREGTKLTTDPAVLEALGDLHLDHARAEMAGGRGPSGQDWAAPNNAGAAQKLTQALAVAQQLLQRDRESPHGLRLMAQTQLLAGRLAQARQALEQLRQVAPDDGRTRLLAIRLEMAGVQRLGYIGRRRFERILPDVQLLLASAPDNREALMLLSDLYGLRRRHAEQAEVLGRLYEQTPANATLAAHYLNALGKAGKTDELAEAARKAFQANPASDSFRLQYARALIKAGKADQAGTLLEGWMADASSTMARPYEIEQAHALAKAGKFEASHALLDQIIARGSDDDSILPRVTKLSIYAEAKEYGALEAYADKWLTDGQPGSALAMMLPFSASYSLLLEAQQFDRAISLGKRHLALLAGRTDDVSKSIIPSLRVEILQGLIRSKQRELSVSLFEEMLAAEGEDFALLASAPSVYLETQDYARIVDLLQRARKAAGEDDDAALGTVLNNLGYMWANHGENLDQAEEVLRKALQNDPRSNVQDSLAWALYKKGLFAEALECIEIALSVPDGEHAVIFDHAADLYWRTGKHEQAVKMWTEALDLAEAAKEFDADAADEDTLGVLERVPPKLKAAAENRQPPLAPLGQNVLEPR